MAFAWSRGNNFATQKKGGGNHFIRDGKEIDLCNLKSLSRKSTMKFRCWVRHLWWPNVGLNQIEPLSKPSDRHYI